MTDPISPYRTLSTSPPEAASAGAASATQEIGPPVLLPEPLPQSSWSADASFQIGALYVQMLGEERAASRKNAVVEEAKIEHEVNRRIADMRRAAKERFSQAFVSGISKVLAGAVQAAPPVLELVGLPLDKAKAALAPPTGELLEGLGVDLLAGCYKRDAEAADRGGERHDANAKAAERRYQTARDGVSDLQSQIERVLGYMRETDQARADARAASGLRA